MTVTEILVYYYLTTVCTLTVMLWIAEGLDL